jgi:rubrerythrin
MPPQGIIEPRRMCPYCSKEVSEGYMWLHKRQYCPMRPGRQEEIRAEAMGIPKISVPPGIKAAGTTAMGASPPVGKENQLLSNNITSINLMEEYQNMVKVMKKKAEEEVDIGEEWQCADCNGTFHALKAPKHCPECGIEFA